MADIAASDLTYTIVDRQIEGQSRYQHVVADVAFGDAALTYPSGGVPLTKASLGCANALVSLVISDAEAANGLVYKYDSANETVRIYEGDYAQSGDSALVELDAASDAPAAATLRVIARGY